MLPPRLFPMFRAALARLIMSSELSAEELYTAAPMQTVTGTLEWIARITSHIPWKGAKQVIYYGAYSQAWRGRERRQGISGSTVAFRRESEVYRIEWAAL